MWPSHWRYRPIVNLTLNMIRKQTWIIAASRQAQIVELGGLKLLLPLTRSKDVEVQRLAVHALANLSVDGE